MPVYPGAFNLSPFRYIITRDALRNGLSWLTPTGEVKAGLSFRPDADGILHLKDKEGKGHEVMWGDITLPGSIFG